MKFIQILTAATVLLFTSCSKDPGTGGKATITGTIIEEEWDQGSGLFTGVSYLAPEIRVYIDYAADGFLNDDIRTNFNGKFEFRWLRKGDYEIIVYSECPLTCDPGIEARRIPVSINSNSELVELDPITIQNW